MLQSFLHFLNAKDINMCPEITPKTSREDKFPSKFREIVRSQVTFHHLKALFHQYFQVFSMSFNNCFRHEEIFNSVA